MSRIPTIETPREMNMLVAFSDLTRFARFANSQPLAELFTMLSEYYELAGDVIESAGGRVVKFIGDAILIAFPEESASGGVQALLQLREAGDSWFAAAGSPCRHIIKCHVGPVCCGPIGTRSRKHFDIFGETVNTAATLRSHGFAMTPQVFRKLDASSRKLFKKHTPPVSYIDVRDRHVD